MKINSIAAILAFTVLFCALPLSAQQSEPPTRLTKGTKSFGFSVGFENRDVENDMLLTIVDVERSKQLKYNLVFSASRFIADNVALNAKIGYNFSDSENTIEASLLDFLIEANNYSTSTASSTLSAAVGVKNYVPMGTSKRFYLFNESNLVYSHTTALTRDIYNAGEKIHKIERDRNSLSFSLSPGLMYYLTNKFAFEFALNPVMLSYSREHTITDEETKGHTTEFDLSLKLNVFNIYFGFLFFL